MYLFYNLELSTYNAALIESPNVGMLIKPTAIPSKTKPIMTNSKDLKK